jgi:hypothetical protein
VDIDPGGQVGKFFTLEDITRAAEIQDLARLRWLLNLVENTPGHEVKSGEIVGFVCWPRGREKTAAPTMQPPSDGELRAFIRQFIADFNQFVGQRGKGGKWTIRFREVTKTLSWEDISTGGSCFCAADWKGTFLLQAADLIERYGSRIRQCAYGGCERIFLSSDPARQKFCSPECGAVERQQRFRAKKSDWTDYRRQGRERRAQQRQRQKQVQATIEKMQKEPK